MSKNKIWKDEVEIHDWDTWCEYYEDTDNNLDDGTWYEIYMSGYGRGQQVTKKMIIKDMIEKFEIGLISRYIDKIGDIWVQEEDVKRILENIKKEWGVK